MTPQRHYVLSIVTLVCCFVSVGGLGWCVIDDNTWLGFLLFLTAIPAAIAGEELFCRLVPARCPDCGTRCRLATEPVEGESPNTFEKRPWVLRYYCPKCNHRIC